MGHEVVQWKNRSVIVRDSLLWLLRHFALEALSRVSAAELGTDKESKRAINDYFSKWDWLGPGVITNVDLDKLFQDRAELISPFKKLLDQIRIEIKKFNLAIPCSYLNGIENNPSYLEDLPTKFPLESLASIEKLVSEA